MAIDKALVQAEPVISAIINTDNTGVLSINSRDEKFAGDDAMELRQELMSRVFKVAAEYERPVRVSTMDEDGLTTLLVSSAGDVQQEDDEPVHATAVAQKEKVATASTDSPAPTDDSSVAESSPVQLPTRRSLREAESFLTTQHSTQPSTRGWRGLLAALGIKVSPSAEELSERADIAAVSRHWPGTRRVTVVNRKGGASKTPTVVNLAATLARYGGGGLVAYDGNPEVGTLGWRTQQDSHAHNVLDVLHRADALLSPEAVAGDMARYVHHQPADKFDVLRSDDNLSGTHVMTGDDVDTIQRVAAKYYRMVVMDTGNSDRGSDWEQMVAHTDQLVVPTTTMEDRAEAALLTLKTLQQRNEHAARLAENAVVIVSQWQPGEARIAEQIAAGFRPYVRDVVTVPFDPALKSGRIVQEALRSTTRRAWLAAAAAVARGL